MQETLALSSLTSTENSPAAWPAATFLALSSKNAVVSALAWAASSASWNACTPLQPRVSLLQPATVLERSGCVFSIFQDNTAKKTGLLGQNAVQQGHNSALMHFGSIVMLLGTKQDIRLYAIAPTTLLGLQMIGLLSVTIPLFRPSSIRDSKQITPCAA